MTRKKPGTSRSGTTHDIELGKVKIHLTANRGDDGNIIELFGKASGGFQGFVNVLCSTASLALQHGCSIDVICKLWRHTRFEPSGIAGQGTSIPDAIAKCIDEELKKEKEKKEKEKK